MTQKKTALVTGSVSGIGLGIAKNLARQGYKTLVSDINLVVAQEVAQGINQSGGDALAFKLDVTVQADIDNVIAHANEFNNRIDVLVNNAGIQYVAKLEDFPTEKWQLITNVLLVGPAMMTKAVLPLMRANNFGRIINIGSLHGLVASPYKSAYVAAKHGIIGFSKVIALETGDQDITINTICPAYVKTPLVEKQIADTAKEHGISEEEVVNNIMLAPMPKKAFIDIEEICASVTYLASELAKNMTGQTMVLDGGWVAR
ncbi:3-hydroxybutyrate dehydrogenase [Colwellia sp. MB02u-6]|uniref:3-hydroxybutyrate dehydrogenase n=1 Tax=Colwellia sp. MB02u-6 TaxID=2759824 RepID=UPI0015F62361|nr:3-hydroxybutyrate dehydrogenase [Colwellia sp. MB02u-6]MBA6329227.1 3-hydroxybutyrate dehydrogenase [Colwellia sp. MB02u-6]